MRREYSGPCLSAVFVDYDNIYLSLKRKDEALARRFAKDAGVWLKEIELGRLITPTNGPAPEIERRLVMNRCYGNPVPRRNSRDNSTDMSSFPFVRHHFLRSGFEIIDCPPLTAQLKNSSDIRMVMDIRDLLNHDTYFDEFIILSGDADFTPVLHRLRAHARRTVIFANEYTASPYTAICDGEIREADLAALLMEGVVPEERAPVAPTSLEPSPSDRQSQRDEIAAQVVEMVRASNAPVPIEALADRAQRALGHERTIGTSWAGHGAFRTFLLENLPADIKLSDQAPYVAYEPARHGAPVGDTPLPAPREPVAADELAAAPAFVDKPLELSPEPHRPDHQPVQESPPFESSAEQSPFASTAPDRLEPTVFQRAEAPVTAPAPAGANLQNSIAKIQDACQAPPLAPPEYRVLFDVMAAEINENGLSGAQTITNVASRAQKLRLEIKREDVRFVLDVVSEADPWFEQGASANLFAGRFRNFVVARCRGQGLALSVEELDLIDAWFAGGVLPGPAVQQPPADPAVLEAQQEERADQQWSDQAQRDERAAPVLEPAVGGEELAGEDMGLLPRIVRSRMSG